MLVMVGRTSWFGWSCMVPAGGAPVNGCHVTGSTDEPDAGGTGVIGVEVS